jgi:hypothetical protein
MNPSPRDLRQIQQWMQSVVMHPGGVGHGVNSPEARSHIAIAPDELESVICRSRAMPAEERLAIYNRAYFARLLECLRAEFPVLVHALGDEAFDSFAIAYLQRYPSRSYTLGRLADNFARYLAETRPRDEDPSRDAASWPDFVIDLAAFERALGDVFDGPGVEDEPLLGLEQLEAIPADRWPQARLVPVPSLRLLRFRFPVHAYFSAVRRKQDTPIPPAADTLLAVIRRQYVVRHYPLSPPQHVLLDALLAGGTVGEAIAAMARRADGDLEQLAGDVRRWFHLWARDGFFRAVEPSPGDEPPG